MTRLGFTRHVADFQRRKFLGALAVAVYWPTAVLAQRDDKLPTIGLLGGTAQAIESQRFAVFIQRLEELGWIEGRTATFQVRQGEGRAERFAEIAAEFVRLKVDVIVAAGTAPTLAAKGATAAIPIVFPFGGDPVGSGMVASLARPSGNATGLSNQAPDLAGKRLEIMREVMPRLRRLGTLANLAYPGVGQELSEVRAAAAVLNVEVVESEIKRGEDIPTAFDGLKGRADALYVVGDPLLNVNRVRIITLSLAHRLPAIYVQGEYVEAGGLMSYGPNFLDLFRRAAELVDKILRGAKPADIPVEQPTTFHLAINLTTAKAFGLTIPPTLLARADEVIE